MTEDSTKLICNETSSHHVQTWRVWLALALFVEVPRILSQTFSFPPINWITVILSKVLSLRRSLTPTTFLFASCKTIPPASFPQYTPRVLPISVNGWFLLEEIGHIFLALGSAAGNREHLVSLAWDASSLSTSGEEVSLVICRVVFLTPPFDDCLREVHGESMSR